MPRTGSDGFPQSRLRTTIMPMRPVFPTGQSPRRYAWLPIVIVTLLLPFCWAEGPRHVQASLAKGSPAALTAAGKGDGGMVVDGIAAIVNREAVTRSEVEDAAWFVRFSSSLHGVANRSPLDAAEYQQALDHLVDQKLLVQEQQKAGFDGVPDETVQHQIEKLAEQTGGMAALATRLGEFHLDMASLRTMTRRELSILRFLDEKLRPGIVVGEKQIEEYYQKDFVPAAQAKGMQPAPLERVREEIRRILVEQEMDRQQQQWLQQLRATALIKTRASGLSPTG